MSLYVSRNGCRVVLLAALVVWPAFAQKGVKAKHAEEGRVDAVLQRDVRSHDVACAVAMVVKGEHVVYSGAFGMEDDTTKEPAKLDTIFRIASMTKPVTAVAVMQLVEAGKIKLDEPAGTYLKAIGQAQVLDHIDPKTGDAVMRPPKTPVTIRELLSNTSGFAYDRWDARLHAYRTRELAAGVKPEDFKEPLMSDPRTRWEYGTSTTWLGRIVEAVSGETLAQYFHDHIFVPLGMKDSFFIIPLDKQDRVVTLQTRGDDGKLHDVEVHGPRRVPKFFDGGGGLSSTAPDYARLMEMILGGGKLGDVRLLKADTVREMETNQIGGLMLQPFKTTNPKQSIDGMVPGGLDKFGLGFAISSKGEPGGRAPGSIAWAGLENTFFWIDPRNNLGGVIMMQVLPFLDPGPIGVFKDFEHIVYSSGITH